jgi:hypothetical protein
MTRKRSYLVAIVIIAILAPVGSPAQQPSQPYPVSIQAGLNPRMSPSDVAGRVRSAASRRRAQGAPEPSVVKVECVDGAEFRAAFSDPAMHGDSPIWRVHLSSPAVYVVDDSNGEIVAYGIPGGGSRAAPDRDRLEGGR